MKIEFISEYKSVKKFDSFEMDDFSFLTGKNGSGKTHFLLAIKEGAIRVESISQDEIMHFDNSSFIFNFLTKTDDSVKRNAWQQVQNAQNHFSDLKSYENSDLDSK